MTMPTFPQIIEMLERCHEFLEKQADVVERDCEIWPNEAMALAGEIGDMIERIEAVQREWIEGI